MSNYNEGSEVGSFRVHTGRIVTPDGVTDVTVINDGDSEWHTAKPPIELMAALAAHCDVASWTADEAVSP